MPTSNTMHVDDLLSNLSIRFGNESYFAEKVFSKVPVTKESDFFPVYDMEQSGFRVLDTTRADRDEAKEVTWGWKMQRYVVDGHALKDIVTDRSEANADAPFDLMVDTTQFLTDTLLNGLDYAAGAILASTSTANNANNANADWTNYTTASPKTSITTAKTTIFEATGKVPNVMVMSVTTANKMTLLEEIKEERKYTNDLTTGGLPKNLWGLNVIEVPSLYDAGVKGYSTTLTSNFADTVWIGYVKPGPVGRKELTYGAIFETLPRQVKTYRWEKLSGTYVEVNWNYGLKVIAPQCGYVLTSVFTA